MPRGPHRRWKGCPMCKEYKDDRLGDAERMPYAAVKQFPTPDGHRVSRHDTGQWGDDDSDGRRGNVPGAFSSGRYGAGKRRKKDTKRWCRGVTGREHKLGVQMSNWGNWSGRTCGPLPVYRNKTPYFEGAWQCRHEIACQVCGKVLREWLDRTGCPAWWEARGLLMPGTICNCGRPMVPCPNCEEGSCPACDGAYGTCRFAPVSERV